jgi:O-antigen/teichoic acid export membrane protein
MLGYYTNAETVGLYHPVIRTAGIQNSILLAFGGIFTPMFSRYFTNNDHVNMQHIYRIVTRWILTMLIPILIFVFLFSKKILLLFGPEYLPASNILILLSIGTSIYALFGISGSTLVVSGHQRLNLLNTFVAAVLNIILNIILIPKYGLAGAAWATFISLTFIAILRVIETRIILSINPFYSKDIKALLAGLVTLGAAQLIKPYIMGYHTVVTIILAILFIAVIYLIIMVILQLDRDDKDFISSIDFLKNMVLKARK